MPVLEYFGVRVRELARSRRFYCDGLGLVSHGTSRTSSGGTTELLEDPETHLKVELNLYPDAPTYREGDELDHLGFRVDDLDATIARLESLGGKVRLPPYMDGGARMAFIADPDGIWVELFQPTEADQPPTSKAAD